MLSLLCAWARHLKTRTERRQAICTSVLPASKTPVHQKSLSSNTLHLYQCKLENEQRKNYRILISSCSNTDSRLFDFYSKQGLGPDQSHYKQSRRWSWLQTTLAQITRIAPKWIYTKIFSQFTLLRNLRLPLKKAELPEKFYCSEYTVLFTLRTFNNLRLLWKQSFPLNFSLCWIYFYYSGSLGNAACPEKQSCPEIVHYIEYTFYHSGFLNNLR